MSISLTSEMGEAEHKLYTESKMAKSMVEGKTSDFWAEVRRIRGCKFTVTASVNGEVYDSCIADIFANKYKTLYNSVSYDPTELRKIMMLLS